MLKGEMTPEKLATECCNMVNSYSSGDDEDRFVAQILNEHRTLQQSWFKVVGKLIVAWASRGEYEYDLRNEFTVRVCRELMETLEKENMVFTAHDGNARVSTPFI